MYSRGWKVSLLQDQGHILTFSVYSKFIEYLNTPIVSFIIDVASIFLNCKIPFINFRFINLKLLNIVLTLINILLSIALNGNIFRFIFVTDNLIQIMFACCIWKYFPSLFTNIVNFLSQHELNQLFSKGCSSKLVISIFLDAGLLLSQEKQVQNKIIHRIDLNQNRYQLFMLQRTLAGDPEQDMRQRNLTIITNRSQLIEQNEIPVTREIIQNFKISTILQKAWRSSFLREVARFVLYALFVLLILSLMSKSPTATFFSIISKDYNEEKISSVKQIPGLFPVLTNNWEGLVNKWDISLINGENGPQNYRQSNYQLQFKHFDQKQDVVYVTKGGCNGHLIMNWEIYGNNIYFTDFVTPKSPMIIPNEPEDERCIQEKSQILTLLKHSTIWTISYQNSKTTLFLLVEQVNDKNQHQNSVIIADLNQKD